MRDRPEWAVRDDPNIPIEVKNRIIADIRKERKDDKIRAKHKIELHLGPDRSISSLKPSAGLICIWESGKKFHGGGDDKMYWCGYDDCQHPFSSDNFAAFHAVCPKCQREMFLDMQSRQGHIDFLIAEGQPLKNIERLPCAVGEKLFRLSPTKQAELVLKTFRALGSNADIYLKYHPKDIRIDKDNPGSAESINKLVLARIRKKPLIYPLANIIKDTSAGADLHKRFLAMLVA
jgi:hypothetical protein